LSICGGRLMVVRICVCAAFVVTGWLAIAACSGKSGEESTADGCGGCPEKEECGLSFDSEPECCPTCEAACTDSFYQCGSLFYDWCEVTGNGGGGCWCGKCAPTEVCVYLECVGSGDCGLGRTCVPESDACGDEFCAEEQVCVDEDCVDCVSACNNQECGVGVCGESCGDCDEHLECDDGQCVCPPANCDGKDCGEDGCGGKCGTCDDGHLCSDSSVCTCVSECSELGQCGDDGCGGNCGNCVEGFVCEEGLCVESGGDPMCIGCFSDQDCGSLECFPLGGGAYCFGSCESNDDCLSGWWCESLAAEGKQCIPHAFNCDIECLATGCPEGEVCSQETGQCLVGGAACAMCQQDWDCESGFRCYKEGHYCAPTCGLGDGECPVNSQCKTVNNVQVSVCVSDFSPCCYGDDC
jgi:hypothetical protein